MLASPPPQNKYIYDNYKKEFDRVKADIKDRIRTEEYRRQGNMLGPALRWDALVEKQALHGGPHPMSTLQDHLI